MTAAAHKFKRLDFVHVDGFPELCRITKIDNRKRVATVRAFKCPHASRDPDRYKLVYRGWVPLKHLIPARDVQ